MLLQHRDHVWGSILWCGVTCGEIVDPSLNDHGDGRGSTRSKVPRRPANLKIFDEIQAPWIHFTPQMVEGGQDLLIAVTSIVNDDIKLPARLADPLRENCRVALVTNQYPDSSKLRSEGVCASFVPFSKPEIGVTLGENLFPKS
jgi:hypothetical protein